MRLFWWIILLVSGLTLVFSCELAHARPASPSGPTLSSAHRDETRRAQRAMEIGEFAQALARLEALFLASDDPALLVPMATCHRELGHPSEAARALRLHAQLTR